MELELVVLFGTVLVLLFLCFRRANPTNGSRAGKSRQHIEEILKKPESIRYDPLDISPFTVSGPLLKLVGRLLHTAFGKTFMIPLIRKKNGFTVFSGEYIPEEAMFTPERLVSHLSRAPSSNAAVLASYVHDVTSRSSFHRWRSIDLYNAYKSGNCDPLDVTKGILRNIALSNRETKLRPPLFAIIQFNDDEVIRMAEDSSSRWKKGEPLSYLDGVPISIKGSYKVIPYGISGGTSYKPMVTKLVNEKEAVLVSRLRQAGAVIIGIANLHEACAGITGSNPNQQYGTPRNPYNTNHFCGGSSSGSGSSIAAGLCMISMGSDAGGSIRIPAAYCGVVGLKPTYGLLEKSGTAPFTQSVGVVGPLAASAIDTAIVMDVLCPGKVDLSYLQSKTLDGVKFGVFWEYFEHADEEIVSACKLALKKMVSVGAECIDIKIPEVREANIAHAQTTSTEFGLALAPDANEHDKLSGETLFLIGMGYALPAVDYINCQKQRTRSVRALEMLFDEVDVIVTPTTGCLAPKIPSFGGDTYGMLSAQVVEATMRFVALGNLTGIPGIAVPVGISSSGLPISLQIMGPWFEEGRLIHIANVLEQEVAGEIKKPDAFFEVFN